MVTKTFQDDGTHVDVVCTDGHSYAAYVPYNGKPPSICICGAVLNIRLPQVEHKAWTLPGEIDPSAYNKCKKFEGKYCSHVDCGVLPGINVPN